jgi:hypothetical protein
MKKEKTTVISLRVPLKHKEYVELLAKDAGCKDTSEYLTELIKNNMRNRLLHIAYQQATWAAEEKQGITEAIPLETLKKIMDPKKYDELLLEIGRTYPEWADYIIKTFKFEKENEEIGKEITAYLEDKFNNN